jgi:hypothetical protein
MDFSSMGCHSFWPEQKGPTLHRAGPISLTVIAVPGCIVPTVVAPASSSFKHPALTGPTTLTMPTARVVRVVGMVTDALPMATISTDVHKSPSLTAAESCRSAAFSTVSLTVPKTICFRVRECPIHAGDRLKRSGSSRPKPAIRTGASGGSLLARRCRGPGGT